MITMKALMALPFFFTPVKGEVCRSLKPKPTEINIIYTVAEPVYDFSKTKAQLTAERKQARDEWLTKHGLQALWSADDLETAGLAAGGSGLVWNFRVRSRHVDRYGTKYCAHFDKVELEIFYRTIIYIPKDFPEGTCRFNVIHEHEMEHHITNGLAVEKYITMLRKDMPKIVRQMEAYGYVGRYEFEERVEVLKQGIKDAVDIYLSEAMVKEMKDNNAVIDSPESYAKSWEKERQCDL